MSVTEHKKLCKFFLTERLFRFFLRTKTPIRGSEYFLIFSAENFSYVQQRCHHLSICQAQVGSRSVPKGVWRTVRPRVPYRKRFQFFTTKQNENQSSGGLHHRARRRRRRAHFGLQTCWLPRSDSLPGGIATRTGFLPNILRTSAKHSEDSAGSYSNIR